MQQCITQFSLTMTYMQGSGPSSPFLGTKWTEKIRVESNIGYIIRTGSRFTVYLMWIGKTPQYFHFCLREYVDRQPSNRFGWSIFQNSLLTAEASCSQRSLCSEYGMKVSFLSGPWHSIKSGFAHLLPGVSGLVVRSLSIFMIDQESVYAFKFIIQCRPGCDMQSWDYMYLSSLCLQQQAQSI